jgi:Tol biopolymer transport system component
VARAAACIVACVFVARGVSAASLVDPAYRFRTLTTAHFSIHFHQGEDRTAGRLAAIAEDTWQKLKRPFGENPPPHTHVILVDQTELSNGFATPVPYDTVFVTAVWPAGSDFIGNLDDWLRLVFTHEFTHIVHLDRSEGWARFLRGVFGRTPYVFPNLFLPTWQIEGIATYEESVITGEGRLHAGDFKSVVTEAAREHALEPLDRVNGGLTDWPAGDAAYAYGAGFHAYLADRYGAEKFAALADATSGRVPYTASRVFKRVFGRSLGELWRDYEASVAATAAAAPASTSAAPQQLTHHGFTVSGPRFAEPRCATCAPTIVYAVRTPDAFPTLNEVALDGSAPTPLTRRYLGSTSAVSARTIYFDQQEVRRNVGVYSDIYAFDRGSGDVARLTSEARLIDPDLSPDRRALVCAQNLPGRRDLVLLRLGSNTVDTLLSAPETQFNAPRWSPDGRSIAVERHRLGALPDVVVVEVATRAIRVVASSGRARIVTPAWRPDGAAIVAAVSEADGPFNLYEFAVDGTTARQLTDLSGGATWPDVSADGRTIAFAGYTAKGYDVFTVPYPAAEASRDRSNAFSDVPAVDTSGAQPRDDARPSTPYSPWPTLAPTSWAPVVQSDSNGIRVGAGVFGYDALQYHSFAAAITWLAAPPLGAATNGATTVDWQLSYAYNRWRPVPFAAVSMQTSFFAGPPTAQGVPTSAVLREQQLEGGVLVPIVHTRSSHEVLASLVRIVDDYTLATRAVSLNRSAARAAWTSTNAHTYGYSISPEGGVTVGATAELIRSAFGAFADATTLTVDARAYLPGLARHQVVALRAAGGSSSGNVNVRETFLLGGPGPNASTIDFGRDATSLLRGFGANTFAGTHVGVLNADYRLPIARPQRGIGTWPLFLHTIHAAAFADAGHAWTETFRRSDIKTSIGGELSTDLVAGYFFPFTATAGGAWGHDGSGAVKDGATLYFRIGHAF